MAAKAGAISSVWAWAWGHGSAWACARSRMQGAMQAWADSCTLAGPKRTLPALAP